MRVGIFGYGLAGRTFHAPLIKIAGFDIVAIQTSNPERARQAKEDFPNAAICSDSAELLSHNLDLAVVASINTAHEQNAKAAIDAGVAVVVDKPMAVTLAGTRELFNYAESKGVPITVYFNRLWDSDTLTIKKNIELVGTPHRFEAHFERFRPDLAAQSWREQTDSEHGGGLLLDLQTHLVSTAIDCFGPAKLKYAKVQSVRGASDDDVLLILEHENGVVSSLAVSAIAGKIGPRAVLLGSKGAIVAEKLDPQEPLLRAGEWDVGDRRSKIEFHQGDNVSPIDAMPGDYSQFYIRMREFLRGNGSIPVSKSLALQVAEIIEQARSFK